MLTRLLPRLLLAALLLIGSELLLWTNPLERPFADWLLLIPAYVLTAALLLDVAARFRIRDFYDVMLIAGIYGVFASLLINPAVVQAEPPVSLIARGLGAHTLLGLEMIGLFLILTGGIRPRHLLLPLFMAIVVGLAWGTWLRWSPVYTTMSGAPVALETGIIVLIAALLVAELLFIVLVRSGGGLTVDDLLLGRRGRALVIAALIALFALRVIQLPLDVFALILFGLVLALCLVILWFRRLSTKPGLLVAHFPPRRPSIVGLFLILALFLGAAVFAFGLPSLPLADQNQFLIVTVGFLLYGLGWLPFVCAALGINAYARQVRTRPM